MELFKFKLDLKFGFQSLVCFSVLKSYTTMLKQYRISSCKRVHTENQFNKQSMYHVSAATLRSCFCAFIFGYTWLSQCKIDPLDIRIRHKDLGTITSHDVYIFHLSATIFALLMQSFFLCSISHQNLVFLYKPYPTGCGGSVAFIILYMTLFDF